MAAACQIRLSFAALNLPQTHLAYKAREAPETQFTSLIGMVFRVEGLRDSFKRLPGNKAPGVDGVRKDDYAKDLDRKLEDLSRRLRDLAYVPQPGPPKAGRHKISTPKALLLLPQLQIVITFRLRDFKIFR